MRNEAVRQHLFRFFGYGNPESPLWFVGIEDGGPSGHAPVPEAHAHVALESGIYHHDPALPGRDDALRSPSWAKYRDISM